MSTHQNICGVVVHFSPGQSGAVTSAVSAMPGVEIHARTEDGRLVLTAIDTDSSLAIDQIAAIHRLPGVVSAALVYHVIDEAAETGASSCACDPGAPCSDHAETSSHARRA